MAVDDASDMRLVETAPLYRRTPQLLLHIRQTDHRFIPGKSLLPSLKPHPSVDVFIPPNALNPHVMKFNTSRLRRLLRHTPLPCCELLILL